MHRSEVYFERCYAADFDPAVPIAQRRACWQGWMAHWQSDQPPDRIDYVRERVLRLDPESSAIVALATGTTETADAAPDIAAEATTVTEAMGRDASDAAEGPTETTPVAEGTPAIDADAGAAGAASEDAGAIAGVREVEAAATVTVAAEPDREPATPIGDPELAPRTIPPAHERRMRRAPVMPATDRPHCAEACRPEWVDCTSRCDTGDRFACIRACRLELRTCSRACY